MCLFICNQLSSYHNLFQRNSSDVIWIIDLLCAVTIYYKHSFLSFLTLKLFDITINVRYLTNDFSLLFEYLNIRYHFFNIFSYIVILTTLFSVLWTTIKSWFYSQEGYNISNSTLKKEMLTYDWNKWYQPTWTKEKNYL